MSCTNPMLALNLGVDSETGKMRLKFIPNRVDINLRSLEEKYGAESILKLPCGKCDSCRLTYRKNWSLRCMLESKLHLQNSFVTLTYDNDNYKEECDNRKEDLQKFIHAVRDAGFQFRYFACGEYGSTTGRFHYHIIMFGFWPFDAKPIGKNVGNTYYESKWLECKWNKGHIMVGECNAATCEYVAGYVNKKNELGKQSFLMMSTRPGIGYNYFIQHREAIAKYGVVISDHGTVHFLPKYCNIVMERMDADMSEHKNKRILDLRITESEKMRDYGVSNREEIYIYDAKKMKDKLKKNRRNKV